MTAALTLFFGTLFEKLLNLGSIAVAYVAQEEIDLVGFLSGKRLITA